MKTIRRRLAGGAVAALVLSTVPLAAHAASPFDHIANDTVWLDTAGNEIKAQGGNVLEHDGMYYWVGSQIGEGSAAKKVNLYRSSDLENWTFAATILEQSGSSGDLATGTWLGRPQLQFNPTTQKFVLNVEVNGPTAGLGNAVGFASADSIDGPYTYHGSTLVGGLTIGDHSVFVEGSNAYLVYVGDSTTKRNVTINVAPLASDWLSVGSAIYSATNTTYEAPGITKVGSTYYMFASGKDWWNATPTSYRTSTDLTTWSSWAQVPVDTGTASLAKSYGTQFEQLIAVTGSSGTSYLLNGDRYSQFYPATAPVTAPGGIGRNAWYPVTFTAGGVPLLHGATDVDVDATAGTVRWNEVANGRFDRDVPGTWIPQWSSSGTSGAVKVEDTTDPTRRELTLSAPGAHNAWVYQNLTLPNGTYTVTFDYRSSGGHTGAFFSVKNHGAAAQYVDLKTAAASWTPKSLTFTVTTGQAQIGFWADAPNSRWLNVDNVAVWKQ